MLPLLANAEGENAVSELLGKFGVTWPFFIAQVICFILVMIVLKKYAFGPVQAMLEQRRARIAEGEDKLTQIEKQLAESAQTTAAAIAKASAEALRMINEAKQGAAAFSEQKAQEAIAQAQQILVKAEAAAKADRERLSVELKREFGRLVAATTAQVADKVLTADDQKRLNEATLIKVEA
ncbi:MAG: ATP synthase F0 subunit B [Verrucomicrobia bacterium]|nr:ATP synthase F0 subunit B [Verrucomicrobiota bacterium]